MISTFIVSILFLSSATFAQSLKNSDVTDESQITDDANLNAGITPDHPLYGLDVAWSKLRMIFTFEQKAKAKLGLEIAKKRLLEVREMVLKNKADAASVSQKEYLDSLETAKAAIASVSSENETIEIENEIELEKEIEEHEDEVDKINNELKIRIFARNLTAEQQETLDKILEIIQNKTSEIKVKISDKKEELRAKIKQVRGFNDTEADNEIKKEEIRQKLFELKSDKALEKIQNAIEEIADVNEKLASVNATEININGVNVLLKQANIHLNNSQTAFNNTDFGKAYGQATSATQLAKNANRLLEKLLEKEEESKIDVEIENSASKVKVKIGNREHEFKISQTDRKEIISQIAKRTGLSAEQVEKILKISTKNVKPAVIENLRTAAKDKERAITGTSNVAKTVSKELSTESD